MFMKATESCPKLNTMYLIPLRTMLWWSLKVGSINTFINYLMAIVGYWYSF